MYHSGSLPRISAFNKDRSGVHDTQTSNSEDSSSLFTNISSFKVASFTRNYHDFVNNASSQHGDAYDESSFLNKRPSFSPQFLPNWVVNHQDFENSKRWLAKHDLIESILNRPIESRTSQQNETLAQFLQQTPFFEHFHYDSLNILVKHLELKALNSNQIIYNENDIATHIYLLRAGKVQIQTFIDHDDAHIFETRARNMTRYTNHYNRVIANISPSKLGSQYQNSTAEFQIHDKTKRSRKSFWEVENDQDKRKNAALALALQVNARRLGLNQETPDENGNLSEILAANSDELDDKPMTSNTAMIEEDLIYEDGIGVKRRLFKSIEKRNQLFGIDELPSDIIQWCLKYSQQINVSRLWSCKAVEPSKVVCLKIHDIVNTLHLTQFEKSSQLITWMQSFQVFRNLPNKSDFDRILSFLFVKSASKGKMLVKQDKSPIKWIFILKGELKIIKTLRNAFTNRECHFVIDTIDEIRNPCIGMDMILNTQNSNTSQYSCKIISSKCEYMVIPDNKSDFLLNLKSFRQWCAKRCFELQCLLYEQTQTFYRNHTINAPLIGFPRSISNHTLIHPSNNTAIHNQTVWSLSPLKKTKNAYQHKTGKRMISEIVSIIRTQTHQKSHSSLYQRHSKKFI